MHEHNTAASEHEPVSLPIERTRHFAESVIGRKRATLIVDPEKELLVIVDRAGNDGTRAAFVQHTRGLRERRKAGSLFAAVRHVDAPEAQLDAAQASGSVADGVAEVERRGARRPLGDEPVEVAHQGVDARGRGAERDAKLTSIDRRRLGELRVVRGKAAGRDRQLADAIHATQPAGSDECSGFAACDRTREVRASGAGVECRNLAIRTLTAEQPALEGRRADADSRDTTDSGDGQFAGRRRDHTKSYAIITTSDRRLCVFRSLSPRDMKRACFSMAGALLALIAVNAQPAPDPLDALFARGRATQLGMKTLSASFVETTVSSLLRDPLVSTGTLVAEAPMRVVMTYATPTVKTVALDDRRLIVMW